jgi:hypothetical protein
MLVIINYNKLMAVYFWKRCYPLDLPSEFHVHLLLSQGNFG